MMRTTALLTLLLLVGVPLGAQPADLLLHAPFDGSAEAAFARGDAAQRGGLLAYEPGVRGQAGRLAADCLFSTAGNFDPRAGTVAMWVRPQWPGADPTGHHLFCLYGQRDLPHSYAVNRFNLSCAGGQCSFMVYSSTEGKGFSVSAPMGVWKPQEWHHVAITWTGINSGAADAELRLYLDGAAAGALSGKQIDVGPTDDVMAVGRDQDGSPDYGQADCDELYCYRRALTAEEIAAGVTAARQLGYEVVETARRPAAPAGWYGRDWPFRAPVELPAAPAARDNACLECPVRVGADLAALGLPGAVSTASLRVVPDLPAGAAPAALPSRYEDGMLEWQAPGTTPANTPRRFWLYFRTDRYAYPQLLVSQRLTAPGEPPPPLPPSPDYATATYGKPWDFDDGSLSGIDQWGNKPEYIQNRKVENGILSMDVKVDPWFIWGDMWGQVDATQAKVNIDLEQYPVLEMKVRQSVGQAQWELFGRPRGSSQLLSYKFTVSGTGWQRLRIDLRQQARWRGTLTAFRLDPTDGVDAHIDIDWVRLLSVTPLEHGRSETLGSPSGTAAGVALLVPKRTAVAGATQEVVALARTAAGQPVSGQPLVVALSAGSGGELLAADNQPSLALSARARRGLTDAKGELRLRYRAAQRAAKDADTLGAQAEFTTAQASPVTVATVPGAPHHYRVFPGKVVALKAAALPLAVKAQLADEFDNPVRGVRKLSWETDAGGTVAGTARQTSAAGEAAATWRGEESKRWVYHVRVSDTEGLKGESAAICLLPSRPRTDPIVLGRNGYFTRGPGGPVWLPLGGFYANWVGVPEGGEEGRKLVSFVDATEEELVHWLDFVAAQGVTGLRFMLRAHTPRGMEPMDLVGRVNMPLFAKVLRYLDLARKHDIRFMLTIHEDYTKPAYYNEQALKTFCLPQYEGLDLDKLPPYQRRFIRDHKLLETSAEKYTDPDAMACQDQYTRELLGLLKDNPQLFSWEYENEMVDCPASWAQHMSRVIRGADPVTPICASHGGGGLHTGDPLWWVKNGGVDFYTYHLYPHLGSTSAETDFGAAAAVLTTYGRMAGPCMFGETAGDEFSRYPAERTDDRRYLMRDLIWFSLVNGNPGCFFWNARGIEVEQFRLANSIMNGLDLKGWQPRRAEAAVVVDHPLTDDKYYRTREGIADYWALGRLMQETLSRGQECDYAMSPAGYAQTVTLAAPRFSRPPAAPVAVPAGWQAAPRRNAAGDGVAYVRNVAGIRNWQVPGKVNMFIRERQAAPLTLTLALGSAPVTLTATDLDTSKQQRFEVAGQGTVDLGVSDHDWAVVWQTRK